MKIKMDSAGVEVAIGEFGLALCLGDVYLKVPRVLEFAWNCTGVYCHSLWRRSAT